jgi:hypothetical protein
MEDRILAIDRATRGIYCYAFPPLVVFGLVGHSLSMILFARPTLISNSCCNYCLAAACTALFQVIFGQPFRILHSGFGISLPIMWWCRVRNYIKYSAYLVSSSLITLASVDRFASSCRQVKYRRCASVQVARRLIPLVTIVAYMFQSHILFLFVVDATRDDECWAPLGTDYRWVVDIGFLMIHGFLYPLLMGTFGFLTVYNIRHQNFYCQQKRILHLQYCRLRDFQRMTLIQTVCVIVLTLPFALHKLYLTVTQYHHKTDEQLAWERLSMCLVRLLWFINDSAGFYIYSLSSVKFRRELFKLVDEYRSKIR